MGSCLWWCRRIGRTIYPKLGKVVVVKTTEQKDIFGYLLKISKSLPDWATGLNKSWLNRRSQMVQSAVRLLRPDGNIRQFAKYAAVKCILCSQKWKDDFGLFDLCLRGSKSFPFCCLYLLTCFSQVKSNSILTVILSCLSKYGTNTFHIVMILGLISTFTWPVSGLAFGWSGSHGLPAPHHVESMLAHWCIRAYIMPIFLPNIIVGSHRAVLRHESGLPGMRAMPQWAGSTVEYGNWWQMTPWFPWASLAALPLPSYWLFASRLIYL